MWKARPRQRLWAATSRALRTPSLYERGIRVWIARRFRPPAGCRCSSPSLGNPAAKTEKLVDAEAGYRARNRGRPARLTSPDSWAATTTCRRRNRRRPSSSSSRRRAFSSPRSSATCSRRRRAASKSPATGRRCPAWRLDGSYTAFDVTPDAGCREPGSPGPPPKTGARRVRSGSCGRRFRRALARRSTSRSSTSAGSSSSRWTATRGPTSARSGGSPAVLSAHGDRPEPLRRGARGVRRRRLLCARDAGPAQREPAAAVDVPLMAASAVRARRRAGRGSHRGARPIARAQGSRGVGRRGEGGVPVQLRQVRRVAGAAARRPHQSSASSVTSGSPPRSSRRSADRTSAAMRSKSCCGLPTARPGGRATLLFIADAELHDLGRRAGSRSRRCRC